MKFWLNTIKDKNKKPIYLQVQGIKDDGTKFEQSRFELNQRRRAKEYIKDLKEEDYKLPEVEVTFEHAFKEYYKSVKSNDDNQVDTNDRYISVLKAHIQPYIDEEYLFQYKASTFKDTLLKRIRNSRKTKWKRINGIYQLTRQNELIDKKTIKDAVASFKRFIVWCDDNGWKIDLKILRHRFNKAKTTTKVKKIVKWVPKKENVLTLINSEKNICDKTLYRASSEIGGRLNEMLAICYDDVYEDEELGVWVIHIRHSLGPDNSFRPDYLKTGSSERKIEISETLLKYLQSWMKIQIAPKTHQRKYRRLFPYNKKYAADKVKAAAKILNIEWLGGFAPFRKFSSSLLKSQNVFTEEQLDLRFGNTEEVRKKHYYNDLNLNKEKKTATINKLLT